MKTSKRIADKKIKITKDDLEKLKKKIGYRGCKNCSHQISPLRSCKWLENGGDGRLHLICPKWEREKYGSINKNTRNDSDRG